MLILHDPLTLYHKTVELLGSKLIPALECPERLDSILKTLCPTYHEQYVVRLPVDPDDVHLQLLHSLLASSHNDAYLEHLRTAHQIWVQQKLISREGTILPECFPQARLVTSKSGTLRQRLESQQPKDIFARAGFFTFDMSAGIAEGTYAAALASAYLSLIGARLVAEGDDQVEQQRNVFVLCRPPGHHCNGKLAGGYCYVNNAAISIGGLRHYLGNEVRIAVLDLDFHHGNGTQEIFYRDGRVLYVSIHGEDEYPYYSGSAEEVGEGEGSGTNLNLPLATGSDVEDYLKMVDKANAAIASFDADFLIISLGMDTFHLDPLGSFKLYTRDYETIACRIKTLSKVKSIPAIILMEGGYVVNDLGSNVGSFLRGWEAAFQEE